MKKVLLVNSNLETLPYPVAPLGISLLASTIKNRYNVKIFDATFNSEIDLLKLIEEFKPDFIGIGLRNIDNVTMRDSKWYLKEVKDKIVEPIKNKFHTPIIMGGSGFSIAPKEILEYFNIDYGVYGEGEKVLPELLKKLENKSTDINLNGVLTKDNLNDTFIDYDKGDLYIPKANIDTFINFDHYKQRGNYPIQTKRGCTHKCIYCSYPNIEGGSYRLRPVHEIVDEIEETNSRIPGVVFEFVDSTFNSPLKHAINICKEIIHRKLDVKLRTMGVNPGEVTKELIELMKQAGFAQIDCTPDSASEVMIKSFRKNFTKKKLIECANTIQKYNMPTMWFFMIGAPGETEETILETFDFIDHYISDEDLVHITEGIRIIPNTKLYDIAIQQNVITKEQNVIEPMYYVDPNLGKENLSKILEREIQKRSNVLNSIDTAPSPELMQKTLKYRQENKIDEPMFRTLLRVDKLTKKEKSVL